MESARRIRTYVAGQKGLQRLLLPLKQSQEHIEGKLQEPWMKRSGWDCVKRPLPECMNWRC